VDAKNTCYVRRTRRLYLVSERIIIVQNPCSVKLRHDPYYFMDENGAEKGMFITKEIAIYKELLKACFIGNLTAMYDAGRIGKQYMENVGHQDYTHCPKSQHTVGRIL
jgi:hypothetical protein